MKTAPHIRHSLILLGLLAILAFQVPTRHQLIEEKLNERLADYRHRVVEKCQERILAEASSIVDSILIEQARLKKDTIGKPARLDKPEIPEIIPPKDSTPVAPLFGDTINGTKFVDSLIKDEE